jgi:antitoxin (DNA-binding transcriptional repressor) of toxin-antitoxin stability system
MQTVIAMKDLRERLASIADMVEQGFSFTVIRRSKPSFIISPIQKKHKEEETYPLKKLIGSVSKGDLARNIDKDLYE